MFAKELRQAGHTKRFTISEAGSDGWEVRVEQDSHVVRRVTTRIGIASSVRC